MATVRSPRSSAAVRRAVESMGDASTLAGNSLARRDLTRIFAAAVSAAAPAHLLARAPSGQLAGAAKGPPLPVDASAYFLPPARQGALRVGASPAAPAWTQRHGPPRR